MEQQFHPMTELFTQLGLPSSEEAIEQFFKKHKLKPNQSLSRAPFLSEQQQKFIIEAIADDSDWAEIVDQMDVRLRH